MNERRRRLIAVYAANKLPGVEVLLDNVWDRHNAGAILRSMEGFGVARAYLYYTYNETPVKPGRPGRRAGASATRWVRPERVDDVAAFADEKRAAGFRIVGADWNESSYDILAYRFPDKCILVFGAESDGLSPEVRAICDEFVFIPMVGMVGSYNVSVAASIFLYEAYRQLGGELKLRSDLGVMGRE